jgi:RNase P subunit RPR2
MEKITNQRQWGTSTKVESHDRDQTKRVQWKCNQCGLVSRYEHGDIFRDVLHCGKQAEIAPR